MHVVHAVIDHSSTKKNAPASVNNTAVKTKCKVPLEPLVFNSGCVVPAKRRASRSIPDDSSVMPKRSKGCDVSTKKSKEPIHSPRQRFGRFLITDSQLLLRILLCLLSSDRASFCSWWKKKQIESQKKKQKQKNKQTQKDKLTKTKTNKGKEEWNRDKIVTEKGLNA